MAVRRLAGLHSCRRLGASHVRLWPRGERWALVGAFPAERGQTHCQNSNSATSALGAFRAYWPRKAPCGETLTTLAHSLLQAGDADAQAAAAKAQFDVAKPSETQTEAAARQLARDAVTPFLKPALRRRILEMRRQSEQTVDRHTIDEVLYSGFDAAALEKARAKVTDFRVWLKENKDEIAAIQAIYAGTRPLKLTLADLRQLRDAIALSASRCRASKHAPATHPRRAP